MSFIIGENNIIKPVTEARSEYFMDLIRKGCDKEILMEYVAKRNIKNITIKEMKKWNVFKK